MATATSSEKPAQLAVALVPAPKLVEPNATAPMAIAEASPTAPPTIPTSSDSASARRVSTASVAPRARRSA